MLKALVHLAVPRAILSVEEAAVQGGGFQMAFKGRGGEREFPQEELTNSFYS